jgi:hypothetical protein
LFGNPARAAPRISPDGISLAWLQPRIWAITRDTAEARMLTPEHGVAARVMAISPDRPGTIVVGLNERDAAWHDAWTIDLASGRRDLVFENRDGYRFQVFDHTLSLRLLRGQNQERGGSTYYRYDAGLITPAFDIPHEDDLRTGVEGFERDDSHYHLMSSVGRDRSALFRGIGPPAARRT